MKCCWPCPVVLFLLAPPAPAQAQAADAAVNAFKVTVLSTSWRGILGRASASGVSPP